MMKYDIGKGEWKDWIVAETAFSKDYLGKAEAIMSLGNGYMGLRSATEEPYIGEMRNLFVAGTFNKFDDLEVTELPNAADVTRMDIRLDGEPLDVSSGNITQYARWLNLKQAELVRRFTWKGKAGKEARLTFQRFVSLDDLHLIGQKMEIEVLNGDLEVRVKSGINAMVTNSGTQHFHEGEKRIYDKKYVELLQRTIQSDIDFVVATVHHASVDGKTWDDPVMEIGRRFVTMEYKGTVHAGQKLVLEKLTRVHTSRDKDSEEMSLEALRERVLRCLKADSSKGYDVLFGEHVKTWDSKVWNAYRMDVESEDGFDQLALRFALYHLTIMAPAHDSRMGIAAKGLSGEGYKGHSFWDTEIFILPFFMLANPKVARSLLEYRYHGLEGGRRKAADNGFEGAMYPWEAAWPSDGEATPEWGAVDIVTGKQTKIWSGFIEQHISADIAYSVWRYVNITGDTAFLNEFGYEIVFETATFWASRLEWNEEKARYEIRDVVGPDEYKEHVDNNAFTNHMAHFNLELAIRYYREIKESLPEVYARLNDKLDLEQVHVIWEDKAAKLYLPGPRENDKLISQDDTYLNLNSIDLTKYKQQSHVGSIFADFNLDQVNHIQVSKQADILMLIHLLEDRFDEQVKTANYNYYEPKTLHDSSLSLSFHSILASDMDDRSLAYKLFRRACEIDLGPNMKSSDHGIHAASIGGIWQAVVFGFAGLRTHGGKLRMMPRLPAQWKGLQFCIYWKGQLLDVKITQHDLIITTDGKEPIELETASGGYKFERELVLPYVIAGQYEGVGG